MNQNMNQNMNLYGMTKEEIIVYCRKLESENRRLKIELNDLSDLYMQLEMKGCDDDVLQRLCKNQK